MKARPITNEDVEAFLDHDIKSLSTPPGSRDYSQDPSYRYGVIRYHIQRLVIDPGALAQLRKDIRAHAAQKAPKAK